MCVYVSIFQCYYFFSQVSDSLSSLLYSLHVRLLRALINQSINQTLSNYVFLSFSVQHQSNEVYR